LERLPRAVSPISTVELYATGLGIMLYSPGAVVALKDGVDYMPAGGELADPLRTLVEVDQRAVLLGSGSPQLDYIISVHQGGVLSSIAQRRPDLQRQ